MEGRNDSRAPKIYYLLLLIFVIIVLFIFKFVKFNSALFLPFSFPSSPSLPPPRETFLPLEFEFKNFSSLLFRCVRHQPLSLFFVLLTHTHTHTHTRARAHSLSLSCLHPQVQTYVLIPPFPIHSSQNIHYTSLYSIAAYL